ncbi:site-specific DNA-methyltransferase [Candidatus Sulfurimonas marisnigri]|uniref:site-specific DNA-methyltransferase (adenine-specific) n=1 Tax=Candidatus Sulfurimonas marisnigri TaxID=2740405 RepID=A0A7S7LYV7_9BACT|nr:site-specific DNA-methyltransferase [Candidatus Sulfurimonas marisnigri]QOY54008.1 site-specific DNA-methyltransferase [Candidatus Sulfurimonas marisnigri]
MTQLDSKSMNIINDNIEKLKQIFPEVFSEGKINFAKLQEELGTFAEDEAERYNFTWAGKSEAKRIAQTPSTGTLRPCKEESKDWDTTQNLYIEGDNLEVLKLLQKSYHKQVKMIYIDPPYNTGKDFVYKDNFKDNIKNYLEITGQVDSEGNRLSTNSDTNGRYHSDWLNMMYPRLKLARNLLKDDGVIFISIDDNEVANLRKLCDEIFGEDNFVADSIWRSTDNSNNDAKQFSSDYNHTLIYSKNPAWQPVKISDSAKQTHFKNPDNDPKGAYFDGNPLNSPNPRENLTYDLVSQTGYIIKPPKNGWRWSKETIQEKIETGEIRFTEDGKAIRRRTYLCDMQGLPPSNLWIDLDKTGHNRQSKYELLKMIPEDIFDTPKPVKLLKYILEISGTKEDDIVLDFFSGSATTAHSVMQINSEDCSKRKFICIQLPEETDGKSKAYKAGYKNICEIGKERIRRAGEKIRTDNADKDLSNLDIGFKVLKLDSSNIKTWDSNFENLEQNLLDSVENIKADRSPQDLLYEILLKYGLDLTLPIEEKNIHGKIVYNIGYGALVVCLDDEITIEVVEAIAEYIKSQVVYDEEKKKRHARVVFKDKSFADTNVKTNAIQVLKQFDIDEVVSV